MAAFSTFLANLISGTNFDPEVAEDLFEKLHDTGTWTPTIQDASLSDAEGQTYSKQDGRYLRVGDWVFAMGTVTWTTLGTLTTTEQVRLAGLPYDCDDADIGFFYANDYSGLALSNSGVSGTPVAGNSLFILKETGPTTSASNLLISELSDAGSIQFVLGYYCTA